MVAELIGGEGRMFLSRDEPPSEHKRESRKTRHKAVGGVGHRYKPRASNITSAYGSQVRVWAGGAD